VLAGAVAAAALSASAAQAMPLRYVALGDSYSAGSGVLPLDPNAFPGCLRSSLNYPHVLADRIGAALTDVTCGSADTTDVFNSQYPGVAPQLDAVRADTELVTMTIGGNNDEAFRNLLLQCSSAGLLSLGRGAPCRDQQGTKPTDIIRDVTYPSLVKVLTAVRTRAPRAKIGILSYPWIVPKTGGCFDKLTFAEGDVPYVRGVQATLNDAVARAARVTGTTYVDLNGVSDGHDACQPIGVRWIEPVLQGTNPVIAHPNALGESQMAARALRVLDPLNTTPPPDAAPTPPPIRLHVDRLRRRDGRYSVTVRSTGGSVVGLRISAQRMTTSDKHVVVGRRTLRSALTSSRRRILLPLRKVRSGSRYRVVVRGPEASTIRRATLTFRAR
jgi:lysophospholipase L1-like esterase